MLSKTKILLLIIAVLGSLVLYSCVEEPTVAPVTRPYSALRIANYTINVASMDISIDGKSLQSYTSLNGAAVTNNIPTDGVTDYFDLPSGQREFLIKDAAGDTVYDGPIEMSSYEEFMLVFSGIYDANPDLSTFGFFQIYNGVTYLDDYHQPMQNPTDTTKVNLESDELVVNLVHASAASLTEDPKRITEFKLINDADSTEVTFTRITEDNSLEFSNFDRIRLTEGTYSAKVVLFGLNDTLEVELASQLLARDKIAYFNLVGDPSNSRLVFTDESIMAARPK